MPCLFFVPLRAQDTIYVHPCITIQHITDRSLIRIITSTQCNACTRVGSTVARPDNVPPCIVGWRVPAILSVTLQRSSFWCLCLISLSLKRLVQVRKGARVTLILPLTTKQLPHTWRLLKRSTSQTERRQIIVSLLETNAKRNREYLWRETKVFS